MAITTASYDANGSQTQFTIPFEYIDKADIDVYVDSVLQLQQNSTSTAGPDHPQVESGAIDQGTALINYTFANDTTIEFNNAPTSGAFIFLERTTDDTSVVTFAPGSTIRAAELNLALEQVRFIAQEGTNTAQQGGIPSKDNADSIDAQGKRIENMADANSFDDAVTRRQLGRVITDDLLEGEAINLTDATGGTNSNRQVTISVEDSSKTNKGAVMINEGVGIDVTYTDGNAVIKGEDSSKTNKGIVKINEGEGIDVNYTNGDALISGEDSSKTNKGIVSINEGHAIDVTYTDGDAVIAAEASTASNQGVVRITSSDPIDINRPSDGEVELSIPDGSVLLAKMAEDAVRTLGEQEATPNAVGSDNELGTTAANDKRYDTIYQTGAPSETDWPVGKLWYDHVNDQTLSVWSGSNWLGISSGGTFITQPTVIWVDQANGDDLNDGHRIIDSMKTIKAAVESADAGDIVLVAPGVYRESCPIDITVNNLSIVGQSLRSCFVHPTPATENNSMFRVNSGTLISNFTFAGMKATGARGDNAIDTDSTYGLPEEQGWVIEFYPNAQIFKSPYIQNCTNFSDSAIDNHTAEEEETDPDVNGYFDPNNMTQGGFGGDLTSGPTGGGILIDGAAVSSDSPLRSMVVDAFTQITLDGPGLLCCNNGYGQLVSFFGTFCHYHAKALSGGQLNLSNCTTDYGRYGLIADGKSTTANFTASVTAAAAAGDTTFTIGAPTAGTNWYGSATRPQDNMSVTIGSNTYPVASAVANGSGWDVTVENPDPNANATNLGLTAALSIGDTASFFNRSYISTGGHTFEYVGAGTDYTAAPENGGVPIEANQVVNLNGGKVFQSSTDHNGKFKIGSTFTVNQRTGEVFISLDAYRPEVVNDLSPQLGANLDVNNFNIQNDTTSGNLGVRINGYAFPDSDGNEDQILTTDGSGQLSFTSLSDLTGSDLQDVVDDTTPQLGGNLDVNGNAIVSDTTDQDIVLNPNGSGQIDVSSSIITGVSTPTDASHAVNKSYVDDNFNNYSHPDHTGDVTSTGDGATVIADNAVTYAKMQDLVTANRVLGGTAAGDIGEVQVQTDMIADDAVTGDKLSDIADVEGSYTVASITVDGQGRITSVSSGSVDGGNADTLDNLDSTSFIRSDVDDTVTGEITFNGNVRIRSAIDLADNDILRFGSNDDAELFCNGSHFILDLNPGINNFLIRDNDGSNNNTIFTFNDNGTLTCSAVSATSFNGNATSATTADHADEPKRNTWSGASTWKDICAWTATTAGYEGITNGTGGYVQISGDGKLRAEGSITAASFSGSLSNSDVRNATANSNAGNKGTYAMLTLRNNTANRAAGYEVSGSNLEFSNAGADDSGNPNGSWRLMGRIDGVAGEPDPDETSVWLRYA